MNTVLAGRVVYCDASAFDRFWLERLFEAAAMEPAFAIGWYWDIHPDPGVLAQRTTDRLVEEADGERSGRDHEADSDVRFLVALYERTREAVNQVST